MLTTVLMSLLINSLVGDCFWFFLFYDYSGLTFALTSLVQHDYVDWRLPEFSEEDMFRISLLREAVVYVWTERQVWVTSLFYFCLLFTIPFFLFARFLFTSCSTSLIESVFSLSPMLAKHYLQLWRGFETGLWESLASSFMYECLRKLSHIVSYIILM